MRRAGRGAGKVGVADAVEIEGGACPACGGRDAVYVPLDIAWVVLACATCGHRLDADTTVRPRPTRGVTDVETGDYL